MLEVLRGDRFADKSPAQGVGHAARRRHLPVLDLNDLSVAACPWQGA